MTPTTWLKNFLLALSFAVPALCFAQNQNKDVVIRVVQDGVSHRLDDFQTNITLQRKQFKFQVLFNGVDGMYVFASIKDSVYRFTENSRIDDFSYLKLLELREGDEYNINRELNISETGWSFWAYGDSADRHSFARKTVGMGDRGVICTKAIRQLYHTEAEQVIKLKSIKTPLYLFFIAVKDYDTNGKPVSELMRRKVKIDWIDEAN